MISVTDAKHQAFQDGNPKELILSFPIGRTLTNENIYTESMSLEQSICDESNLSFGNVYSTCLSVRIFDDGLSYRGLAVNASLTTSAGNNDYTWDLGTYTVQSDVLTSDKIYRDLKCYDALYNVLPFDYSQWHNSRSSTFTLKNYRDAFFNYIGIQQESISLPNDNVTLSRFDCSEVSGAQILSAILQLNGCFGYIGSNGKFKYILPKTTVDYEITDNSYIQGSLEYEDEPMIEITGVKILGYKDNYGSEETNTVPDVEAGTTTGSVYTIENNFLIQLSGESVRQSIANALATSLNGFAYYSTSVQLPAYAELEPGDVFSIVTTRKTVNFPVFHRTLSGITGLRESLEAKGQGELSNNSNSVSGGVSSASMAINQMRLSVAELLARKASITDLVAATARITTIETNNITVNNRLTAAEGNITTLTSSKADITDLNAATARIGTLEAGYADIQVLDAEYANIASLLSGNAGVGDLQNIHLTTANAVVDEAVIKNLMATYITVGDLMAGTIDTSRFRIASPDGGIEISGNTQTFTDSNDVVRIQIGEDAQGDFTFVVYNADGTGTLIDDTGVYPSAIGDGLIINRMVADNANVSASKLDIGSLFGVINTDNSHTIYGNKIYLNEYSQTLTQAFEQTTNGMNSLNSRVSLVETGINGLTVSLTDVESSLEGVATASGFFYQPVPEYSNSNTVTINAKVYRGATDIHENFPPSWFSWHKKTEDGITKIGEGYSVSLTRSSFGYGGTVVGRFTILDNALLVLPDGNYVVFEDSARLEMYYDSREGDSAVPLLKQMKAKDTLGDGNVEIIWTSLIDEDFDPTTPISYTDDGYGNITIG